MLLVAASLASAVTSMAFAGLMLAPGGVPAAGPEYEFRPEALHGLAAHPGGGLLGSYEGVFEGRLLGGADGPDGPYYGEFVGHFGGRQAAMSGEFVGSFDGFAYDILNEPDSAAMSGEPVGSSDGESGDLRGGLAEGDSFGLYEGAFEGSFRGAFYGMDEPAEFAGSLEPDAAAVDGYEVVYLPEYDGVPLFIASDGYGPPTDVTSAMAGFLGATAAISMLVLYVGLRESMFYSDWAPRFKRFREQREQIERDLGATPSS